MLQVTAGGALNIRALNHFLSRIDVSVNAVRAVNFDNPGRYGLLCLQDSPVVSRLAVPSSCFFSRHVFTILQYLPYMLI